MHVQGTPLGGTAIGAPTAPCKQKTGAAQKEHSHGQVFLFPDSGIVTWNTASEVISRRLWPGAVTRVVSSYLHIRSGRRVRSHAVIKLKMFVFNDASIIHVSVLLLLTEFRLPYVPNKVRFHAYTTFAQ